MKINEEIKAFLDPIAQACNIELVQVEYAYKNNGMNLTLFIDKPQGITISDCEQFHHAVDQPLDELDFSNGQPYTLNVSSLGLDRKLKSQDDLRRNINRTLIAKFFGKINGSKEIIGQLIAYDENSITLLTQAGEQIINIKDIASLCQHIKFV